MFFKKKNPLEALEARLKKEKNLEYYRDMTRSMRNSRFAGMILIGFLMYPFAGYIAYQEHFVYSKWVRTTAEVVSVEPFKKSTLKGQKDYYRYTVHYSDGQSERTETDETSGTPHFATGEQTPIMFDPANTQSFRMDGGSANDFITYILIMGTAFIIFPAFLIYKKKGQPEMPLRRKVFVTGCGMFFFAMACMPFNAELAVGFLAIGIMLIPPSLALIVKDNIAAKINRRREIRQETPASIVRNRPLE
jgi:hypothetical protein